MQPYPTDHFEQTARNDGCYWIAGVDEVGRGPLAGPVVACAVILPEGWALPGLRESKQLSPHQRERLALAIREKAVCFALAEESPGEVDRVNIHNATLSAMSQAVRRLTLVPDMVLVDGRFTVPRLEDFPRIRQQAIIHGDALCLSIAAASVVAKTYRDVLMAAYHQEYPQYGFDRHKGYGTKAHQEAILAWGPSPLHRKTFIKKLTGGERHENHE